jgi:hypothetical protein
MGLLSLFLRPQAPVLTNFLCFSALFIFLIRVLGQEAGLDMLETPKLGLWPRTLVTSPLKNRGKGEAVWA